MRKNTHRKFTLVLLLGLVAVWSTAGVTTAATIFESGTLGPTGIPFSDLGGVVSGTNIKDTVFSGVRFQLNQPVVTTQIGGHFVATTSGTFFGAIVELDDEKDFPDSGDLSTPDVLGNTQLTFPVSSAEVFGDLAISLDPGWYALVFGSGLFGATGSGATVRNGTDIDDPTYFALLPSGAGWVNRTVTVDHRFVVLGEIVPEPSTAILSFLAVPFFLCRRK